MASQQRGKWRIRDIDHANPALAVTSLVLDTTSPKHAVPGASTTKAHSTSTVADPRTQLALPVRQRRDQVINWLAADAARNSRRGNLELLEYRREAHQSVASRGRIFRPFAPFRAHYSALRTFTGAQAAVLIAVALALALGIIVLRSTVAVALMGMVTILYLGDLALAACLAVRTIKAGGAVHIEEALIAALYDTDWPSYTILCPLHREAEVVPQFVSAMEAIDYPREKLQIMFLLEEDDHATRHAIMAQRLPPYFEIIVVPAGEPRTKPRACNYGLLHAQGDYVVIYDAEDIPDPLQLKKAVLAFAGEGDEVACVQAKLNFYNPSQNLLTRWFTAEYSLWFDLTLPGLQWAGFPLPLGGTSNHFRIRCLRIAGAWDTFNVTEDCDLGLRLAEYGYRTAVLDSTTYEEANSRPKNWVRQRSRWIKGYLQTYLVYMRHPLKYLQPGRFREFLSLQLIVGGKTGVLFVNPIMWLMVAVYIAWRPLVAAEYRTLFPTPIFYMAVLCLIFGNFFYAYTHLVGCLKRRQFRLIKWTLLIPLYWAMASAAAFMALYQLLTKPHYWEKTQHGLHLRKAKTAAHAQPEPASTEVTDVAAIAAVPTLSAPSSTPVLELTYASIVQGQQGEGDVPINRRAPRDPWFFAAFFAACVSGIAATVYFLSQGLILVYGDAYAHLQIARRVADNATPGLAQLGGIWLPLPHILMMPFTWNDWLWRTGLAGSVVGIVCFVVATAYIYLGARRITHDRRASFIGTLVFVLNPNVLYLQATPLSEVVLMATMAMACYYFLAWIQDRASEHLIFAGAATFLATLSRYDGWFIFVVFLIAILLTGMLRRERWSEIEGRLLIFATFGGLGIALWMLWCAVIFGDPLYWQRSAFSSEVMQAALLKAHILYTYHNLWQAARYFTIDTLANVGPLAVGLAVVGAVVFLVRRRLAPLTVAGLIYFAPFVFYVVSLYTGQAAMYLPQAVPAHAPYSLYNARYGAQMVAPAGIFVAVVASAGFRWMRWYPQLVRAGSHALMAAGIVAQSGLLATGGIISLQDGLFGLDCAPYHASVNYLAEHYDGGRILIDVAASKVDSLETTAGIPFASIVYEGSGSLWKHALATPSHTVDWIIMNPSDPNDHVASNLPKTDHWLDQQFSVVFTEPTGLELLHRNGLPPLPTRTVPARVANQNRRCGAFGAGRDSAANDLHGQQAAGLSLPQLLWKDVLVRWQRDNAVGDDAVTAARSQAAAAHGDRPTFTPRHGSH